ncbi:MAG TPA: SDR family oxidoreductase [Longimicrobiales bacterium]
MILVAGGTGSVGTRIVSGLREEGAPVRLLARATSNHAALERAGAEVVIGDLKDPSSLARACRGVTVLITTASASTRGDDSIETVDLRGNANLVDAARAAGVEHFIFVSTVGASADSPVPVFRAKGMTEQRLQASGMTWTVLQPNAFMDVWFPMLIERPAFSGDPVTLVGDSRRRHTFVAEQDVARFAMAAVRTPAARNTTIVIGGPEALTFRDVVRTYEQAAGRSFAVRSVAPGEPIPGLPEPVWGIAAALETYDTIIPMEDTASRYGVRLTTALEFARARVALASPASA